MKFSQGLSISALFIFSTCMEPTIRITGLEGKVLPKIDIILPDSSNSTFEINRRLKPTIVFFFKPSCPYCKAQTRSIVEGIEKLKNVEIFFVTDYPLHQLNSFVDAFSLQQFNNVKVAVDKNRKLRSYFDITSVPFTAVYDTSRKLKNAFHGYVGGAKLSQAALED